MQFSKMYIRFTNEKLSIKVILFSFFSARAASIERKDHRRLKAVRWIILLGWLVQYSCIYPSFDALGEFFDNCCR